MGVASVCKTTNQHLRQLSKLAGPFFAQVTVAVFIMLCPVVCLANSESEEPSPQSVDSPPWQKKPSLKMGVSKSSFSLGASESIIAWEKWHHLIGRTLHKRIKKVTYGLFGEVVLDILVSKDGKLTAMLLSSTNKPMAEVCLSAAQGLDGDPVLRFPPESQRQAVRFTFDYKRGLFLLPKNHYITNDFERVGDESH